MLSHAQPKKRKISVQSFDFDGCLFNDAYYELLSKNENRWKIPPETRKNALIEGNKKLIETVSTKIRDEQFDIAILMVGSRRQFKNFEERTSAYSYGSGSCYPALNNLCDEFKKRKVNCQVDGLLLADIYDNKPAGEEFENAVADSKKYTFSPFGNDNNVANNRSKHAILYAQMCKIASENPNADIVYDFYDDQQTTLSELVDFYNKNPSLIPHNVKLRIHKYDGGNIQTLCEIQGKGYIDSNYRANTLILDNSEGGFSFINERKMNTNDIADPILADPILVDPILVDPIFQMNELVNKFNDLIRIHKLSQKPSFFNTSKFSDNEIKQIKEYKVKFIRLLTPLSPEKRNSPDVIKLINSKDSLIDQHCDRFGFGNTETRKAVNALMNEHRDEKLLLKTMGRQL